MLNILIINSDPIVRHQIRDILNREQQIRIIEEECCSLVDTTSLYRKYDVIFMEYSLLNVIDTDLITYFKECSFDQIIPLVLITRSENNQRKHLLYPECVHSQLCIDQISHKTVIKSILDALGHDDFQLSDEQITESKKVDRQRFLNKRRDDKRDHITTRDLLRSLC